MVGAMVITQAQNIHYTLLSSNTNEAVVRVDFGTYHTKSVTVDNETMQTLNMANAYPILKAGDPELLQAAFSLIIPEGSHPVAEVIKTEFTETPNFELAPSKGMLYRNVDPSSVPYQKNESYSFNHYLLGSPVQAENTYHLRDYHGINIKVYPFDYNPAQQLLKTYSSITVKVTFNGDRAIPTALKNNRTFDNVYASQFLNYRDMRGTHVTEDGDILIIAPENFLEAMQPYANWKTKCGFNTEIVSLTTAGSTANDIKTFISDYYYEHNLAFVVIVGDKAQFPTPTINGEKADNYFTEIIGDDYYPDIILGKISAENVEQVETQVQRFIEYEQNPIETSHFPVFLGIASEEGPGDNNEYDYQHVRNIDNLLLNYTYTSGYELFEGSQGGLDAPNNPTGQMVTTAVNNGVGIITYCGHGYTQGWGTTGFNNNKVNELSNNNKLPFVISVACLNGEYQSGTCFAESWLRATKDGEPTGAVSFIGSTISQPWNPPMCTQDAMIDMLVGNSPAEQKFTLGDMFFNGLIKMLDVYSSEGTETYRTWILFGDPTLQVRTTVPSELSVEHNSVMPTGIMPINFFSMVENTRITVMKDSAIIGSNYTQNGEYTLYLNDTCRVTDTLHVLATAPNCLPYEATISFIPNDIPFVTVGKYFLVEQNIPDNVYIPNGQAEYGETLQMWPTIINIGSVTAQDVRVEISCEDEYITLYDHVANISAVPAHDTINNHPFTFKVADHIPANHNVLFQFRVILNNDTANFSKIVKLHAPVIKIVSGDIDDLAEGNGNYKVDYGETFTYNITLANNGNMATRPGILTIENPADEVIISNTSANIQSISIFGDTVVSFQMTVADSVLEPTFTILKAIYNVDGYTDTCYFCIKIGYVVEDWETGDFTNMEWVNNSESPWTIVTQLPYEGSYCAKSGAISDNESSALSISFETNAPDTISFYHKVWSEEGYDKLTFYIDGQKQDEWSGRTSWARAAYPVQIGSHTFTWIYAKDEYTSHGRDCAYIDLISFPCGRINSELSVEDLTQKTPVFTIWPNPTSDYVHVQMGDDIHDYSYQLFNLNGQLLQGGRLDNQTDIDVRHLVSGIYLLKVENDQHQTQTTKIIKK